MRWQEEEVLVIVKAYPNPSTKYGETVCTAGITKDSKWIRLYPIAYRDLPKDKRYEKFQWIKVKVTSSNERLQRPESYKVDPSSIALLSKIPHGSGWKERMKYFMPIVRSSLEEISDENDKHKVSLGAFKPKSVKDFIIEKDPENWTVKQIDALEQRTLFGQKKTTLEKIPYKFRYKFTCENDVCRGHDMQIFDWELYQSYRRFKDTYKDEELTIEKLKDKWLKYFFTKRVSYFVVGTDSRWDKFMILSMVSPERKTGQMTLFSL